MEAVGGAAVSDPGCGEAPKPVGAAAVIDEPQPAAGSQRGADRGKHPGKIVVRESAEPTDRDDAAERARRCRIVLILQGTKGNKGTERTEVTDHEPGAQGIHGRCFEGLASPGHYGSLHITHTR